MKKVGIGVTLGILLALWVAYILEDLNPGAIGLLTLLCIGLAQSIVWVISHLIGRSKGK